MAESADQIAALAAGRGHVRAAHADRDRVIDALTAAFTDGRLAKDEFDALVGQTLVSRTYAELAAVLASVPAEPVVITPPRPQPSRRRVGNGARWAASGVVPPVCVGAALAVSSLHGDIRYTVAALVVACVYFVCWLSAGADMLWEWHHAAQPAAGACVRCGHTAGSHHTPASCAVRAGSLNAWKRCSCAGYVPPGRSPETVTRPAWAPPSRTQRIAGRPAA